MHTPLSQFLIVHVFPSRAIISPNYCSGTCAKMPVWGAELTGWYADIPMLVMVAKGDRLTNM